MKRILLTVMISGLMVNPFVCASDVPSEVPDIVKEIYGIGQNLYGLGSKLCSFVVPVATYAFWGTNKTLSFVNRHPLISLGVAVSAYVAWKKLYPKKTQVLAGRVTALPTGAILVEDFTR